MSALSVANTFHSGPDAGADIVDLLFGQPLSKAECYLRMRRAAILIRRFRKLLSRSGGDFGSSSAGIPASERFSDERLAKLLRCLESPEPLTVLQERPWLIVETVVALAELQERRREERYQVLAGVVPREVREQPHSTTPARAESVCGDLPPAMEVRA